VRSSRVAVLYSPVTRCFAASAFTCLRSWWLAIEFRTRKNHAGRNKYNNNNSDNSNSDKINSKSKKSLYLFIGRRRATPPATSASVNAHSPRLGTFRGTIFVGNLPSASICLVGASSADWERLELPEGITVIVLTVHSGL